MNFLGGFIAGLLAGNDKTRNMDTLFNVIEIIASTFALMAAAGQVE